MLEVLATIILERLLEVWRPCCPLCSSSVHLFSPQVLEMPQISN